MSLSSEHAAVVAGFTEEMAQDEQIVPLLPQQDQDLNDDLPIMACPEIEPPPSRKLPIGFELRRSESSQDPYLFNPYTGKSTLPPLCGTPSFTA